MYRMVYTWNMADYGILHQPYRDPEDFYLYVYNYFTNYRIPNMLIQLRVTVNKTNNRDCHCHLPLYIPQVSHHFLSKLILNFHCSSKNHEIYISPKFLVTHISILSTTVYVMIQCKQCSYMMWYTKVWRIDVKLFSQNCGSYMSNDLMMKFTKFFLVK